ncbi:MAG: exo-alpha-sialidase, partial [Nitrososphaerota archaeon]|nr:exo-alpha-sialidase [Nitrososphaerota archaeon]
MQVVSTTKNLLLVGTRKGAFVFASSDDRRSWKASGPYFRGKEIYDVVYDRRNKLLMVSVNDNHWGPSIARSKDLGENWKISSPPKFPKKSKDSVKRIWSITPGIDDEPGVIYCGVEPAMLFRSDDAALTWKVNEPLLENKTRPKWQAGGGGLCMHTILVDEGNPKNIHVGISAVGTLNSKDGGNSWKFQNKNVLSDFHPEKYPEYGQCVHKIVRHRDRPGVLYQQNHCGVFRSDDDGEEWEDIRNNLPSRFGFP